MKNALKTALEAKGSCQGMATLTEAQKNKILQAMAAALKANADAILKANAKDIAAAEKKKMAPAMVARLMLDRVKLNKMAQQILEVAALPDPVGRLLSEKIRPNGLVVKKVSVPIGVILIIYESRPNVTADCMALCLKSGNCVILKGGSEALHSNEAIFHVLGKAAGENGAPRGAFQFVATADRSVVKSLLQLNETIDLVIPRGGEGLIREVARISKIPVIKHFKGVCHVYVDKDADLAKAEKIIVNAKTQNPAVCNAMESLLVHESVAGKFLPSVFEKLQQKNVEVRGDSKVKTILPEAKKASEKDWGTEYLDLVLSARVVKDAEEAIAHIEKYGSRHSDAIVTENADTARRFTSAVDSSAVFVNSSTRFNDGGEFGLGAEMGISTDKLHARGPMGLEELTSYKYIVIGNGQIRE